MKTKQILYLITLALLFLVSFSCNDEDISKITAIKLIATSDVQQLTDQDFSFEVPANNLDTITERATIKVDGVSIPNATFRTSVPGDFQVQAFYEGLESNIINISAISPATTKYVKNVMVEDYTGTWCVNCPRISYAIEQAKIQSDKVISVGIHVFDEMEMPGVDVLTTEFGVVVYPTGKINRINDWENPDNNIEAVTSLTGLDAVLGLAINSSIDGANVNATVDIGFKENITTPLKVVVYLVENGLHYDQANSTEYYNGEDPILDFEHNDVLRAIYTDHLGETIPAVETVDDNIYSFQLQKAIPAEVQNNDELHLVAFVTNANTNEVINVREVKVGEIQELQEL